MNVPRVWPGLLRVTIFILLTAAASIYGYLIVERTPYAELKPNPLNDDVQRRTADKFLEQSSKFTDWSLALLAGIMAIAVTTKVHRTSHCEKIFILLGPAGGLLLMSLRAAWYFQRRLTNTIALDNYSDMSSLAVLLMDQTRLFLLGLTCAAVFGLWYLLNIVLGRVTPYDD